jgi:hypothetical protein
MEWKLWKKKPGYLPGLLILWWALRDSNPEPRDYESPALTVAPRALARVVDVIEAVGAGHPS